MCRAISLDYSFRIAAATTAVHVGISRYWIKPQAGGQVIHLNYSSSISVIVSISKNIIRQC